MATRQRCPKCNRLNDLGAAQCVQCGAPLIQVCPVCGTPRPWYVEHCANCASQADDANLFTNLFGDAPTGRLKGRYVIGETIAVGPTTKVYRGLDQDNNRQVVLKSIQSTALFRASEKRDAIRTLRNRVIAWQAVDHPAVVKVLDSFASGESQYVVMERINGWSLASIIQHRVPVTPMLARNWGAQLARLLEHLHGLPEPLHVPFLAPSHVMITPAGQVKLVGLGLSVPFVASPNQPYGGTKGYVAPELSRGYPTPQSDIFGVSRLLYAALIGRLLERGLGRSIPLREAVPGIETQLVKTIAKGAHRDPAKRYGQAEAFGHALWGERHGPLEPIADWRQVSVDQQLASQSAPLSNAARRPVESGSSMADLGFRPDPRFGPSADDLTRRPATTRPDNTATTTAAQPKRSARSRSTSAGTPIMSLHPTSLNLPSLDPDAKKRVVLRIRNRGDADLVARVESRVAWISAPKQQVRIPPSKAAKVVITIYAERIPNGEANVQRALGVGSNTGTQWISASASINSAAVLDVEARTLDFGDVLSGGQRSLSLKLANRGRQRLTGQVLARVPWLSLDKTAFAISGGNAVEIQVRLDPAKLPRGEQTVRDAIVLESDGGQARIAARAWRRVPELDLGAAHMAFGDVGASESIERVLIVGNSGDAALEGSVRSLVPHLQVWPGEIACQPGDMEQISVTLDTTGLNDGPLHIPQAVRVQTNGGSRTLGLDARISAPKLVIETERIDFDTVPLGEQSVKFIKLSNLGSAAFEADIASLVPWLATQQTHVTCGPQTSVAVPVSLRSDAFDAGQQIEVLSAVRITSGSLMFDLPASVHILQPSLQTEPDSIDFGYVDRAKPERRTLDITNAGTGDLAWQAQWDAEWVELTPSSGVCAQGETQSVSLTGYGLAVEATRGQQTNTLIISSDGGRAKVPLTIGLAEPMIATDMRYVDMVSVNRGPISAVLRVFNHGLGTLEGTIRSDSTWLAVDRVSCQIEMGRSAELTLTADLDELPTDAQDAQGALSIESNGGDIEIEVTLKVELWPEITADEKVALSRSYESEHFTGRLSLKNAGMGSGHAELTPSHAEITSSPSICDIRAGRKARVTISVPASVAASGDAMWIDIAVGDEVLRVPLELK